MGIQDLKSSTFVKRMKLIKLIPQSNGIIYMVYDI